MRVAVIVALFLQASSASAQTSYSPEVLHEFDRSCRDSGDVPAERTTTYCACFAELAQKSIPQHDFILLNRSLRSSSWGDLNPEQFAMLKKLYQARNDCMSR